MLMSRDARAAARAEWLEARRQGIGSSDAPVILGLTTWKSPLALYAEKAGLVPLPEDDTDRLRWGHRLEPAITQAYEEDTGRRTYDPGDFTLERHGSAPWMIATLDRLVVEWTDAPHPPPLEQIGVLELKTADAFKREVWREEPPLAYQVQLQHQLAVSGHQWGSIACLIGGHTFVWQDVARNDAFIAELMLAEERFWQRVQQRDPPPPDASKASSDILQQLYPQETEETIALPVDAVEWDRERRLSMEIIATHEDIKHECENRLRAALGTAAVGVLPTGVRYTWKTRKAYTANVGATRILRRIDR